MGTGSIHHVAWGVNDDDAQLVARADLVKSGLQPTPQIDRNYFHSIYFREPGTCLFEVATAGHGFTIDEPEDKLGTLLMIPPNYEEQREQIIAALPVLPVIDRPTLTPEEPKK
jgi:glyoxalase family protein